VKISPAVATGFQFTADPRRRNTDGEAAVCPAKLTNLCRCRIYSAQTETKNWMIVSQQYCETRSCSIPIMRRELIRQIVTRTFLSFRVPELNHSEFPRSVQNCTLELRMLLQINWRCVKDTHTGPSELRSGGRGRYRALPFSARIEANDNSQLGP
jgi:hypothetical protein